MGASVYEDPPFIIMEWMPNGNVLDFIHDKPTANRVLLVNSFAFIKMDSRSDLSFRLQIHQVSLGLAYLHARNTIHGDLKAVNDIF